MRRVLVLCRRIGRAVHGIERGVLVASDDAPRDPPSGWLEANAAVRGVARKEGHRQALVAGSLQRIAFGERPILVMTGGHVQLATFQELRAAIDVYVRDVSDIVAVLLQ